MEWLPLLLIPFGALALAQLFDNDDSDQGDAPPEPADPTQGTQGDDTLTPEQGFSGRVMGWGGDDVIEVGSPTDPDRYYDSRLSDDNGHWTNWPNWDPDSTGGVPPGVVLGRGGMGDDTLIGNGTGIDLGGDDGDDVIQITGDPVDAPSTYSGVARGGDGNDTITAGGAGIRVLGGAGDDWINASGRDMAIDGGDGADRIDVTGLTNSVISVGANDSITGRGEDADGLRFLIGAGADFTGNASDEVFTAISGGRVDGGGGDDLLRTDYTNSSSSTLIGGAGNDTVIGNDAVGDHASTAQDGYHWRVGRSSDRLDGGAGDDIIGFDRGDTITGGAGADRLDGFVDSRESATVTDFDPAEDWLRVNIPPAEAGTDADRFGNVSVAEEDGDTIIRLGHAEIMRIENATGLNIGFQTDSYREEWSDGTVHEGEFREGDGEVLNDNTVFTDLDGNEVDRDSLDVVINNYLTLYT